MSNLERIYENLENLIDDLADTKETKEAHRVLEEGLGDELYKKYENEIHVYGIENEKHGFIYGFRYAMSLIFSQKGGVA